MDLTEVWGRFHWLRESTSANQLGQESNANITGKGNSQQGWKPWAPIPAPRLACSGTLSNFLGLSMSQWSPLWKEKREGSWKVNSNLQNFYYILNLCNMHPRHSLHLINTATLGSLYIYSTDEKSETTVIGESILLPWNHTVRMSHTGSGNERCVWMWPQMHTTSLESILTGFRTLKYLTN